jgi:tetratricopeptide (TPR) repeat protein
MDIDIYQQCPCHSEKKIKFCCGKDIVTDLNEVLAKNAAGQGLAALDQLDRAIKKTGPRDCLLTIQTHILIAHGEIDKAQQSNELFMEKNPKHSTGLHHRALIQLAQGDVAASVESLQDAMDAITGNEIPLSLANAFRMVGLGLLQQGHIVGARAHLRFAQVLKSVQDNELNEMIMETYRLPGASLLLKQEFRVSRVPEEAVDEEWAKKYQNVQRALDRGQFRKALKYLKKIDTNFPDHPIVGRAIAIISMYLGYIPEISSAWRRYSRMPGLTKLTAIESESLAQIFEVDSPTEDVPIMRVTFEVTETDGALETALSCSRLASINGLSEDPFEEGPPPRNAFYVLDQKLVSADELRLDTVSDVTGELLLFGKQTDRSARLEWVVAKDSRFEADQAFLLKTFGDLMSGAPKEQEIGSTTESTNALSWNWHLPEQVSHNQHADLVKQKTRAVLLENWSNVPFSVLDGKTPREAAQLPELEIPLQALIFQLEQSPNGQFNGNDAIGVLRAELGLVEPVEIEIGDVQGRAVSPLEQQFLNYEKLSDEQLLEIQSEAMMIGNVNVLRKAIPEILNRPEMKQIPRDVAYSVMAQISDDDEAALDYLSKARSEAKSADRPIGIYLVQEFELRLSRGMTEKLPSLLQTIQMHHADDPDVEYHLSRVLERFGLLQGRGPESPTATAPEPVSVSAKGMFSADSTTADSASPSESDQPSKLWLPD